MYDYGQNTTHHRTQSKTQNRLNVFPLIVILSLITIIFIYIKNNEVKNQKPLSPTSEIAIQTPAPYVNNNPPSPTQSPVIQNKITSNKPSQEALIGEIDNLISNKQGDYGWYVMSLDSGSEYGNNFDFAFTAASINKIPIMISFLLAVQNGAYAFDDTYTLESEDLEEGSGTLQYQRLGSKWKMSQLIEFAGHYSDNTAINAMHRLAGFGSAQKLIEKHQLNTISIPKNTSSPRDMVTLLSLLYSGKLIKENALVDVFYKALQKTEYEEDLIPEGVPSDVLVSHKIGWQVQVWSDCGIVFGSNPYALCIMNNGVAEAEARELIPQISRKIWLYEENLSL